MALVTTPNGSTSNSYASLAEFDAYADYASINRESIVTWLASATDPDKEGVLIVACRALNINLVWTGQAATETQALSWGRVGMMSRNGFALAGDAIPIDLKNAQCEYALQIGAGDLFSDNKAASKGVSSVKAGSVSVSFHSIDTSNTTAVDIIIKRLSPELGWTRIPQAVRDLLVESWYVRESVKSSFMFEVL